MTDSDVASNQSAKQLVSAASDSKESAQYRLFFIDDWDAMESKPAASQLLGTLEAKEVPNLLSLQQLARVGAQSGPVAADLIAAARRLCKPGQTVASVCVVGACGVCLPCDVVQPGDFWALSAKVKAQWGGSLPMRGV